LDQDVVLKFRDGVTGRWKALAPKTRRVLVAGVAGSGVLLIALATAPSPATTPAGPPPAESTPTIAAEAGPDPALSGDDPVAAARALVALRAECIRSASLLCLDGVVQAGSSAEAADRAAVTVIQTGGEAPAPIDGSVFELVERLGASALVSLGRPTAGETAPASLLLMKGEAGWRIRDYVAGS